MPYAALTPFDYAVFGIFYFFSISVLIYPVLKNLAFPRIDYFRIGICAPACSKIVISGRVFSDLLKISTFTENQ